MHFTDNFLYALQCTGEAEEPPSGVLLRLNFI